MAHDAAWLASRQRKPEDAAAAAAAATSGDSAFGAAACWATAGFATKSVSQPSRPPKEGDEEVPAEETAGAGGGHVTVGGGGGAATAAAAPGAASVAHHSFISAAKSRCVASEGPPNAAISGSKAPGPLAGTALGSALLARPKRVCAAQHAPGACRPRVDRGACGAQAQKARGDYACA